MTRLLESTFPWFFAIALLMSCSRQADTQKPKDGEKLEEKLIGTWLHEEGDWQPGQHFTGRTTVFSNHDYVCKITITGTNSIWTQDLEGNWQIEDGVLIDTVTKHSNTNARLPMISRAMIIRLNDHELVVKELPRENQSASTNEIVFQKAN